MHSRTHNGYGTRRDWYEVARWPRWARILFVVTFPLSGPLYAALFFITLTTLAVLFAVGFALAWAVEVVIEACSAIADFLSPDILPHNKHDD